MSFSLGRLWIYTVRHEFIAPGVAPAVVADVRLNLLLPPLVFLLSTGIAAINPQIAMYCWVLLLPAYVFRRRPEISLIRNDLP
jgi:hypothetical protein